METTQQKVSVCRIVLYNQETGGGANKQRTQFPAIVSKVYENGNVDLWVSGETHFKAENIPYGTELYNWEWPARG